MKFLATVLFCACAILTPAKAAGPERPSLLDAIWPPVVQAQNCQQRVGPFATQQRAWNMWNQAQSQGYSVSNGVAPCWQGGSRGYCFFVFYAC